MAITVNGTPGISASAVATLTNKTLDAPIINNATFTGQQAGLQVAFNDSIVFEGTTANAFETTLSAGDPTADRTVTLPDATDTLVGKATTDTLTNKSISLGSNTVTGTTAQFNTALSDGDFATLAGSETLSNKTLTSPIISSISNTGTITVPTSTGTLALTSGVINNTLTTTTGDMIYASSANTPARLAVGSTGQVLTVAGGVPTWATASAGTTVNDPSLSFGLQVYA